LGVGLKDPAFTQGLVPMILPVGDAEDIAVFRVRI
jgi:hypothetical protein